MKKELMEKRPSYLKYHQNENSKSAQFEMKKKQHEGSIWVIGTSSKPESIPNMEKFSK